MTVQQLIEQLQRFEPNLPVLTHGIYEYNKFDYVIAEHATRINVTQEDNTFYLVQGDEGPGPARPQPGARRRVRRGRPAARRAARLREKIRHPAARRLRSDRNRAGRHTEPAARRAPARSCRTDPPPA